MTQFVYPSTMELREIEQDKLPNLLAQRAIFDIMGIRSSDDAILSWEQEDNYTGLQALRGVNGQPTRVQRTGAKRFLMQPGIYGEFSAVDEQELLVRRQYGTWNQPVNISDIVMREQDRLLGRRLDRMELIGWNLVTTGTFSVSAPTGAVAHTDTYAPQTFTAAVSWATANTSTPLADLRAAKLKARGHSVRFDANAKLYMNSQTLNNVLANNNSTDLYGRRAAGLQTVNSPGQLSALLTQDNLPTIVEYDGGYLDSTGTFQLFIPNNIAVLVGQRMTPSPICEYVLTRNVNNPSMEPGAYTRVFDRGEQDVPRSIEIHDGHNGGPIMLFPSAIVIMSV